MASDVTYRERLTSARTTAVLFVLALAGIAVFVWAGGGRGPAGFRAGGLVAAVFFALYAANYLTLTVEMSATCLRLRFGVFRWTIPWASVEGCRADDMPLWRVGGAGVHFTSRRGRYRVMFNFLEYPRVVVALRARRGLVRDVAFSTQAPLEVMRRIDAASHAAHFVPQP